MAWERAGQRVGGHGKVKGRAGKIADGRGGRDVTFYIRARYSLCQARGDDRVE
jgi:hypothetical protein